MISIFIFFVIYIVPITCNSFLRLFKTQLWILGRADIKLAVQEVLEMFLVDEALYLRRFTVVWLSENSCGLSCSMLS